MTAIRFPEFSVEITLHHGDQVVCRRLLLWACFLRRVKHVKTQVSFDQLRHQSVKCSATGSNELQNLLAFAFILKGPFNGFYLAPDAPDAREGLRFVLRDVRQ